MDSVTDAEDVTRVLWVPAGRRVAEMGLGGEEHFQGYISCARGVVDHGVWVVDIFCDCAEGIELVSWWVFVSSWLTRVCRHRTHFVVPAVSRRSERLLSPRL